MIIYYIFGKKFYLFKIYKEHSKNICLIIFYDTMTNLFIFLIKYTIN